MAKKVAIYDVHTGKEAWLLPIDAREAINTGHFSNTPPQVGAARVSAAQDVAEAVLPPPPAIPRAAGGRSMPRGRGRPRKVQPGDIGNPA